MYWDRATIFPKARFSPGLGIPPLLLALLLGLLLSRRPVSGGESRNLPAVIFAVILVWMAAFVLCYGTQSFRAALFPLCCLLLMIPIPAAFMDGLTVGLQHGSADVSYALLRLAGIPVFRQGMTFSLPGLDVQVAPECSGIRSCLVFMVMAILASRIYLRSGWRRLALIIMTIPIAIFKNAVRIVVISSLSAYVNRAILSGPLHHSGGPVFALIGIALFVPLLFALHKSEIRSMGPGVPATV
jgi:exosortase